MHVDVRVLAATNKDLEKAVETGSFREDLFFRLAVFPLRSPSLRERVGDIPKLAIAFMNRFAEENGSRPKPIDDSAVAVLSKRHWPGNVRELKNVVERAAILSGSHVTIADLPEDPHENPFGDEDAQTAQAAPVVSEGAVDGFLTLRAHREQSERNYLLETLRAVGWNISRAAILLGVERTNLHKKIRAHGIKRGE
jgi:two-component system, NtrC family, nitrogen regulation response regulator NtrX